MFYFLLFQSFASTHSNDMHLMALTCHVMAGIVYLTLMAIYEVFINRWIILTKIPANEIADQEGEKSKNNLPEDQSEAKKDLKNHSKETKPSGGVDAFRPNLTFMVESKPEAEKYFERKKCNNFRNVDEC